MAIIMKFDPYEFNRCSRMSVGSSVKWATIYKRDLLTNGVFMPPAESLHVNA